MPLTETEIRQAKPADKPQKLFDGAGLYLLVKPDGARYWRIKYRCNGAENVLSLGVYPRITLKRARELCRELREQLDRGIDPSAARKAKKRALANTFEAIGREWLAKQTPTWSADHGEKVKRRLEQHLFPWIGRKPIRELAAADILDALQRIERRGKVDTAHRARTNCSEVFRFAVATRRAERDPTVDLKGALTPLVHQHYAALREPDKIGELLRAIEDYRSNAITVIAALRLLPLVFVRSSELRFARWPEFDLQAAEWRIPPERMKMKTPHIVPLATQALTILRELHVITGPSGLVFPGIRSASSPISENTINAALRRLGYTGDEMTGHGFRTIASTLLNEQGWNADAIERQLSHQERDDIRGAYNHAEYLPERRRMMQAWADYLDTLRADRPRTTPAEIASITHQEAESPQLAVPVPSVASATPAPRPRPSRPRAH